MNRNPLNASIKAALAMGTIKAALHHTFGNPEPADPTAIEREAALKIPRKDAGRELARRLQAELDEHLAAAIGRALGVELTDPQAQLAGHAFECVTVQAEEGDTYCLDGVPILWAGPVTTEDDGEQVRVHRAIRHLNLRA